MLRFKSENPEVQDLTKLWQPSKPDKELSNLVKRWEKKPSLSTEAAVARRLAEVSHSVIRNASAASSNIRAAHAINSGSGNCVAHTEATLGFAEIHELPMLATWNGSSAAGIWMGIVDVWEIYPYDLRAETLTESYSLPADDQAFKNGLFMLDPIVRATGLIASTYLRNQGNGSDSGIEVNFIPDFTFTRGGYRNGFTMLMMSPEVALSALQKPSTIAAA